MIYKKKPLTVEQQINKLQSRGLKIHNRIVAANYLSNISYYRLRAYTYPFQDNFNETNDHRFLRNDVSFQDIIDLYCFDRRLRALIFNAIEKIEIAVRTKITYAYSVESDNSHWFNDSTLFKNDSYTYNKSEGFERSKYKKLINDIGNEINRSNEDFIKHYKSKYSDPVLPPSWMTLEVLSFSSLSRLFKLLRKDNVKNKIAKQFGINKAEILENWLHAISDLRNCCAHHSRIWNRRFIVQVMLPYNSDFPFMKKNVITNIKQNKLFAILSCIKYILDIVSPQSEFKNNLLVVIGSGGKLLTLREMGFPADWESLEVWRDASKI